MAERVCPIWVGYLLLSPLRKLGQNPQKILGPYIKEGMQVLDIGCAMGFFSLPLAEMVGPQGKVICVDMQEKMLGSLKRRAQKAGLSAGIETRLCSQESLGLQGLDQKMDLALAFAVLHEVPDVPAFFSEIHKALKSKGQLLIAEPKGHASENDFEKSLALAEQSGFKVIDRPRISRSLAALLEKQAPLNDLGVI